MKHQSSLIGTEFFNTSVTEKLSKEEDYVPNPEEKKEPDINMDESLDILEYISNMKVGN